MPSKNLVKSVPSFTFLEDKIYPVTSDLIIETLLQIIVNGECYACIMITPDNIRELVTGFLFTEGLISRADEIKECIISPVSGNNDTRTFKAGITISSISLPPLTCVEKKRGLSSKHSLFGIKNNHLSSKLSPINNTQKFSMTVIKGLSSKLRGFQPVYKRTGGAHAAFIFDSEGNKIFHSEDVGRHNALDKVIGASLINETPFEDKILVSSGRASLKMTLKAARAGFPVFVALSRPTQMAVEAAIFYNITLINTARNSNRIYSHVQRIDCS